MERKEKFRGITGLIPDFSVLEQMIKNNKKNIYTVE